MENSDLYIDRGEFITEIMRELSSMKQAHNSLALQLLGLEQSISQVGMMYATAKELESSGVKLRYFRNENGVGYQIVKEGKIGFNI